MSPKFNNREAVSQLSNTGKVIKLSIFPKFMKLVKCSPPCYTEQEKPFLFRSNKNCRKTPKSGLNVLDTKHLPHINNPVSMFILQFFC